MRTLRIIHALLGIGILCCRWPASAGADPEPPGRLRIRVAVVREAKEAKLAAAAAFTVEDLKTHKAWGEKRSVSGRVIATSDGLRVFGRAMATDSVLITCRRAAALSVNGRPYRGDIVILKDRNNELVVINVLDIEDYIKGVLVREISHRWPVDAIKAQAVATRTYAVYQMGVMKEKPYDVSSDTSSQVYGGVSSEQPKTNRVVDLTRGEVLVYRDKVFPAYFHATCGGMTESATELWKTDIPPLAGGRVCPYCGDSPHFFWKASLDPGDIQEKLRGRYTLEGRLAEISVAERDGTGRARTLTLTDVTGETLSISAKDFRQVLGSDLVRSTNFTVVVDTDDQIVFQGRGWGHGVGLCQWGARGMSREGYDYKDILAFYYPGTTLKKLDRR